MKGVLARWVDDRGFGFIKVEGGVDDLFVHWSDCKEVARASGANTSGLTVGIELQFEISDGPKKKAINVRPLNAPTPTPTTTTTTTSSNKTIFFKPNGRVVGVAVFLIRTHAGVEEVLLCSNPPKGNWESSGFLSEPTERCIFDRDDDKEAATDLTSENPSSHAVASIGAVLGVSNLEENAHISVFTVSSAKCFQTVYVRCPDTISIELTKRASDHIEEKGSETEGGSTGYESTAWFPIVDVTAKVTGEKILQHTEQRVHFVISNRKVRGALGLG